MCIATTCRTVDFISDGHWTMNFCTVPYQKELDEAYVWKKI